jgi:hypothetical protein
LRKRAATKGDAVVDVKPGEEAVSVNVGWTVEKFVALSQNGSGRKNGSTPSVNGKKPAAKTSSSRSPQRGKRKATLKKKPMAKGKASPKKSASKRASKPVKKKKK